MALARRNKSYNRRNFSWTIFQVKEDLLEGGVECLTLWITTKDEGG